jgi:hypothetical protein
MTAEDEAKIGDAGDRARPTLQDEEGPSQSTADSLAALEKHDGQDEEHTHPHSPHVDDKTDASGILPKPEPTDSGESTTRDQPSADTSPSLDRGDWRTLRHCAEVVSLCRVRDAMGTGMEGMMGFLRCVTTAFNADRSVY